MGLFDKVKRALSGSPLPSNAGARQDAVDTSGRRAMPSSASERERQVTALADEIAAAIGGSSGAGSAGDMEVRAQPDGRHLRLRFDHRCYFQCEVMAARREEVKFKVLVIDFDQEGATAAPAEPDPWAGEGGAKPREFLSSHLYIEDDTATQAALWAKLSDPLRAALISYLEANEAMLVVTGGVARINVGRAAPITDAGAALAAARELVELAGRVISEIDERWGPAEGSAEAAAEEVAKMLADLPGQTRR
jgi:hypothetical protein